MIGKVKKIDLSDISIRDVVEMKFRGVRWQGIISEFGEEYSAIDGYGIKVEISNLTTINNGEEAK